MKRCLLIFFVVAIISGCSTTYIGRNDSFLWKHACKIESKNCQFSLRDFNLVYDIKKISESTYEISGKVKWSRNNIASSYKEITRQKVVIAFMDEASVVYQKAVYVLGNIDNVNSFNEVFETDVPFSFSTPVAYSYRIWEGSF